MRSTHTTVGTTATLVVAADNIHRTILLHSASNTAVYYGGTDVTTSNGFLHEKDDGPLSVVIPINETLYAVVATGTETVTALLPDA